MKQKCIFTVLLFMLISSLNSYAQPAQNNAGKFSPSDLSTYNILVFQDKNVGRDISDKYSEQIEGLSGDANRGFLSSLFSSMLTTSKQTASTGITGLVATGVSYIGNLVRSKKNDWRQVVTRENRFEKTLTMLENLDDFYGDISLAGALDPSSLAFNGIGCLQQRGQDTVFYVVCHLDTTDYGIKRILHHSKFELTLDTLVFNPTLCDLPNDSIHAFSQRQKFSFNNSKNLNLLVDMDITSSWINQAIQVYNDCPLGHFSIEVPLNENSLDADGLFRYYRGATNKQECDIVGECFIVPRSYVGVRDSEGRFHDAWGTGQYKVRLKLSESCDISPELEQNWKADWKRRKQANRTKVSFARRMQQYWDANGSKWVTNLIEIPASALTSYMANEINKIGPEQQQGGMQAIMQAMMGGQAAAAQAQKAAAAKAAAQGKGQQPGGQQGKPQK